MTCSRSGRARIPAQVAGRRSPRGRPRGHGVVCTDGETEAQDGALACVRGNRGCWGEGPVAGVPLPPPRSQAAVAGLEAEGGPPAAPPGEVRRVAGDARKSPPTPPAPRRHGNGEQEVRHPVGGTSVRLPPIGEPRPRWPRPGGGVPSPPFGVGGGRRGLRPGAAEGEPRARPRGCRGWKRAAQRGDGGRKVGVRPRGGPRGCRSAAPGARGAPRWLMPTGPETGRKAGGLGPGAPGAPPAPPDAPRRRRVVALGADLGLTPLLGDGSKRRMPAPNTENTALEEHLAVTCALLSVAVLGPVESPEARRVQMPRCFGFFQRDMIYSYSPWSLGSGLHLVTTYMNPCTFAPKGGQEWPRDSLTL